MTFVLEESPEAAQISDKTWPQMGSLSSLEWTTQLSLQPLPGLSCSAFHLGTSRPFLSSVAHS